MRKGNKKTGRLFAGVVLAAACGALNAASLYKWVDEDGNVTYQDEPPPANVSFEKREYTETVSEVSDDVGVAIEEAAREHPVSLYTIPVCDVCDLVRLYLERHSIPFAEKNVQSSPAMQQELELLTGEMSVPVLAVGEGVIDGYSKAAIRGLLGDKGFPMDQIEQSLAAAESSGGQGESGEPVSEPVSEIGSETAETAND